MFPEPAHARLVHSFDFRSDGQNPRYRMQRAGGPRRSVLRPQDGPAVLRPLKNIGALPMVKNDIPDLQSLLRQDLDYICGNLQEEFARMAGKRLLITGGAGFLGYYLVHAALHFNRTAAGKEPIHVTVWDNFIRGTPAWLTGLRGTPNLVLEQRDLIEPLPQPMPDIQWIIHAAGIASPPFYRK